MEDVRTSSGLVIVPEGRERRPLAGCPQEWGSEVAPLEQKTKQAEFAEASTDAWRRVQAFVRQHIKA